MLETKDKIVNAIMTKDVNLSSYFVRHSKESLIVVSVEMER